MRANAPSGADRPAAEPLRAEQLRREREYGLVVAPLLLNGGDLGEVAFMVLGFILLGLSFGQSSGVVASNFRTATRYTGSALTSDLAWLVGAGFAPLVALAISAEFGLAASGAYLLSGAVVTGLALFVNKELAGKDR